MGDGWVSTCLCERGNRERLWLSEGELRKGSGTAGAMQHNVHAQRDPDANRGPGDLPSKCDSSLAVGNRRFCDRHLRHNRAVGTVAVDGAPLVRAKWCEVLSTYSSATKCTTAIISEGRAIRSSRIL